MKFRQASNLAELPNFLILRREKSITSPKPGSHDFWQIANSIIKKDKSFISHPFNSPKVFYSPSDKAKLFAENFSKKSNLDESIIS